MRVIDKLDEKDLELLKEANIIIENKEYSENEYLNLEEKVCDAMMDSLNENQDYTPKALEYERIHDKLIRLENEL